MRNKFKIQDTIPDSKNKSGMALIIIVAIIAILSAIGVSFMYTMRMEEKAAFNYVNSLKASYIAKSGIDHAIAVLKSDGGDTGYDAYSENWGYDTTPVSNISVFGGSEVNLDDTTVTNNGTGGNESKWIYVTDDTGSDTVGRYAVLIIDESSKININTAGNRGAVQGWKPFEISLERFFNAGNTQLGWGLGNPQDLADGVVHGTNRGRYGLDGIVTPPPFPQAGQPNIDDDADSIILEYDGIDNDADWDVTTMDFNGNGRPDHGEYIGDAGCDEPGEGVDDPYEFVAWDPYFKDTIIPNGIRDAGEANYDDPFIVVEEIADAGVALGDIDPYITVYSSDENTNDSGFLRMNINLVKDATALYTVMYDAWEGLIGSSPDYTYDYIKRLAAQCAVNTIDYADTDNVSTFLKITDETGAETPTIARGIEGIRINEIMVKPAYQWEAKDLFKNQNPLGTLPNQLGITNWYLDTPDTGIYSKMPGADITAKIHLERGGFYRVRVLSYDDCVYPSTDNSFGVYIYNNDDRNDTVLAEDNVGGHNMGGWLLEDLGVPKLLSNPEYGHPLVPGDYTVVLKTSPDLFDEEGTATDTDINRLTDGSKTGVNSWTPGEWVGDTIKIMDGTGVRQTHTITNNTSDTVEIDGNWSPTINIGCSYHIIKTGARLGYIQFSQQPDCEYVELVNISDTDIEIGGWELTTSGGFVGRIPNDTIIEAKDYMVLTVDRDDNLEFMLDPDVKLGARFGTGIDNIAFKNTWPGVDLDKHVRALQLSTSPVNIAENVLGDTIVLRGGIFEDSPIIPKQWEDSGIPTGVDNNTLTEVTKTWDVDQWKGATITANMTVNTTSGGAELRQITRQIISNTSNKITINTKWAWDGDLISISVPSNYYIFFPLKAVTLWKGPLADRKIVAQVNYRAKDINQVCYIQNIPGVDTITPVYGFIALEKNDPTAIYDLDGDGVDDFWHLNNADSEVPSIKGGTPGGENSIYNKALDVNMEIRNLPFATIGDIKEVSICDTTNEWSRLGYLSNSNNDYIDEIRALADKITVSAKRLEAENSTYYSGVGWDPEQPAGDTFLTPFYSISALGGSPGIWTWGINQRINPDTGIYTLYISGKVSRHSIDVSDTMLVTVTTGVEPSGETRVVSFSEDNIACFGQITIGGKIPSGSDGEFLQLEIAPPDTDVISLYFDAAILAPEYKTYGVININTADTVVLQALPGIDKDIADSIVAHRKNNSPFHTIGEILDVEGSSGHKAIDLNTFSKISNLITTKSKVFTIISQGQALRESDNGTVSHDHKTYEILGEKKYIVVMER